LNQVKNAATAYEKQTNLHREDTEKLVNFCWSIKKEQIVF